MGKEVLVELRIMPSENTDFEELKKAVESTVETKQAREEPIAFGLKALVVTIIETEEKGSELEEKIKQLPQVGQIEVLRSTLL